jgi:hypothetical protein
VCQLCAQKSKKCIRPVGHACDLCWKQKKSCSNGTSFTYYYSSGILFYLGHSHTHDVIIKEELKSLVQSATRKRKACPSVDTTHLWTADQVEDDASTSTQSLRKHPKTASTLPNVHFEGVVLQTMPPPPCWSTCVAKTSTKKDLYKQVSQHLIALGKAFEEMSELQD